MRQPARHLGLALLGAILALACAARPVLAESSEDPNLRRARVLYKSGKYREAITELNAVLRRNNRNVDALLWRGKALAQVSEFLKAAEDLEGVIAIQPNDEEAYRELGGAYLELSSRAQARGQGEDSRDFLQKCDAVVKNLLQRNPEAKESYEFLIHYSRFKAELYREQNEVDRYQDQLDSAIRYCEKVLERDPKDVSTHFERIKILFSQKKYRECEKRCNEALEINPQLHLPKLTLAQIAQAEGRPDDAIRMYTEILQEKKTQTDALLSRAQLYLDQKKYELALADANEVLRLTNRNPLANFIRGCVYMQLKKLDAAIQEFQSATVGIPRGHPFKVPAHFWLARCYLLKDMLREAISELNTVVSLDSRFLPARLILASSHLQQGYPDGAITVLLDALPFAPDDMEVRRLLGIAYLHKGEYDQAKAQFKKILDQDPEGARAHQVLAGIALTENKVDDAVQHCLKALAVEPKNVDVHFLLGLAYMRRNRLDGAKQQFEHVLELRGRHPGARMNLAAVHAQLREFDLAQEQLQRCIEEDPSLSKPRFELIRLYVLQRKYDKAEEELAQLLKVEPDKAKVHLVMAELHRAKGEREKAIEAARRSLAISPKFLAAHSFIARLDRDEQNWTAALKELQDALKEDPKYAPAYEAAVIETYLGRYDEAVALFEKAISNDIQRAGSLTGAATALQLKGDYRGALANITQADNEKNQDTLTALQTANIYLAQGDAPNARTIIRQAASYIPAPVRDAYLALIDQFAADRPKAKAVGDALTRVMFYGSRGWPAQAEQDCNLLLKLAPENTFAYNVLADVYHRSGKAEEEIQILQRLIDVAPKDPQHRLRLGSLFLAVGRYKEARKVLEEAAEVDPKAPGPRIALAYYFLKMASYDLCTEQAEKVLALDKDNAQALALLASCYLVTDKLAEAKDVLKRLTESSSTQKGTLPYIYLAGILFREGKTDEALKQYQDAVEHDPTNVFARMGLAEALLSKGRFQEAAQQYQEVLLVDSINAPALLKLAQIARATQRLDLALDYAERAAKIAPSAPEVRFELAAIHMARRQFDKALDEFKLVLKDDPNHLPAKVGMARVLFESGERDAAIAQINTLLTQKRPLPVAQVALVYFYKRLGEIDKAQGELESLITATPDLPGAYDLAVVYIHKDKLDDALRLLDAQLKAQPSPAVTLAKGTALQLKGQLDAAIEAFAEARKASPDNPRLASLLANAYIAGGNPAKAREAIESVKLQPELRDAYFELIDQLKDGGEKARLAANALNQAALYTDAVWLTLARQRYEKLLETLPGNVAVLHLLASVYRALGDMPKALAAYQDMLRTRPNYEPALVQIAQSQLVNKQPDAAVQTYEKLVKLDGKNTHYRLALATALQAQNKTQAAIDVYKELIKQDANSFIAYNNLAWLYATQTNQLKEAEAYASKAADLAPADTAGGAAVRDTLAWIHYLSERYDKALEFARQAVEGLPGSAEVHYHIGMIYLKRNLRTSAVRHLSRALQIDPDLPQKAEITQVLDTMRGRAQ